MLQCLEMHSILKRISASNAQCSPIIVFELEVNSCKIVLQILKAQKTFHKTSRKLRFKYVLGMCLFVDDWDRQNLWSWNS